MEQKLQTEANKKEKVFSSKKTLMPKVSKTMDFGGEMGVSRSQELIG